MTPAWLTTALRLETGAYLHLPHFWYIDDAPDFVVRGIIDVPGRAVIVGRLALLNCVGEMGCPWRRFRSHLL